MHFATWTRNFTIQLKGTNKLINAYTGYADAIIIPGVSGINITITGDGSLEVSSLNWYAIALRGGKLTIDNTTVKFSGDIYSINKNGSSADIVISNGSSNIEGVNCESITDKRFYTIDGMTLPDKPTQTGVYIQNGRKVVIK